MAADPADYRASPLDFPAEGLPLDAADHRRARPAARSGASLRRQADRGRGAHDLSRGDGTIHGYINLSQGIPSAKEDIRGALTVLKAIVAEATGAA